MASVEVFDFAKKFKGMNKTCHMCLKDFNSTTEMHQHIIEDHDLKHPTKRSHDSLTNSIIGELYER